MKPVILNPNLGWEVVRKQNFTKENEIITLNKGIETLHRSDNGKLLNKKSVNETFQYTSIQQLEHIVNVFSSLSGYQVEGYSEFAGGSKVISYLKTDATTIGGLEMKGFLSLGTGYDGLTSFFLGTTSLILSCQNQWSKILQHSTIKNTKNHSIKRDELEKSFAKYLIQERMVYDTLEKFGDVKVNQELSRELIKKIVMLDTEKEIKTRTSNLLQEVEVSVNQEMNRIGDNYFGFFNGITHYTTHIQKQANDSFGNMFGNKSVKNQRAFELGLELLKN
jgi:hypothetical protein